MLQDHGRRDPGAVHLRTRRPGVTHAGLKPTDAVQAPWTLSPREQQLSAARCPRLRGAFATKQPTAQRHALAEPCGRRARWPRRAGASTAAACRCGQRRRLNTGR